MRLRALPFYGPFPWPMTLANGGIVTGPAGSPGAQYPFGVDLATALKMAWNVSVWSASMTTTLSQNATWTYTEPGSSTNDYTGTASLASTSSFGGQFGGGVQSGGTHDWNDFLPNGNPAIYQGGIFGSERGDFAGQSIGGSATATIPSKTGSTTAPAPQYSLLNVSFMDPFWPYLGADDTTYVSPMVKNLADGLYYPRFIVYGGATAGGISSDGSASPSSTSVPPNGLLGLGAAITLSSDPAYNNADNLLTVWWPDGEFVGASSVSPAFSITVDGNEVTSSLVSCRGVCMLGGTVSSTYGPDSTIFSTSTSAVSGATLQIDIVVARAGYWPYKDQNGVQLYDTGTGAPAVDPATGLALDPVTAPWP